MNVGVYHCNGVNIVTMNVADFQGIPDPVMRSAAVDIFSFIVEFSPSMVREFILHEAQKQTSVSIIIPCAYYFVVMS